MQDHLILEAEKSFKISKPAFFILLTSIILCVILAIATVRNLNKGQQLMELSFLRQGTTMIHAFEAGARTSMLFRRSTGHNPLQDLASEVLKDRGIIYIRIIDSLDNVVVSEGSVPATMIKSSKNLSHTSQHSVYSMNWNENIFEVSKEFNPVKSSVSGMSMMERRWEQWQLSFKPVGQMYISIGFDTHEFEHAKQGDMYHTIFMLVMLVLLCFSGIYFLILYRKMKMTHATLINTRLYANNVLESIPDALITLDTSNRIVSCNKNIENIVHMEIGKMVGKSIYDIYPDCPQEMIESDNNVLEVSADFKNMSGSIVPIKIGSARLIDHLSNRIGRVLVMRDVGNIKKMELQLERSRRLAALGYMAAGIAHEVRNPLGTLRGLAHFFGAENGASEACKNYSTFMISEVDRLNQLVSELLQFSAPKKFVFEKINMDALVAKVVTFMESDFKGKGVIFATKVDSRTTLFGDKDLIIQILLNFLKNSLSATSAGDNVILTIGSNGEIPYISIEDSGKGMSEETQNKMFDPFFTDSKDGTGLGLAVCHQIIEQHHGTVEVRSKINQGTTITIHLPQKESLNV